MRELNLQEMEVIEGGKFWGTDCKLIVGSNELNPNQTLDDGSPAPGAIYIESCSYSCQYYVF